MFVMIDNYDSFVYNLAVYFKELNQEILVLRNDSVSAKELMQMHRKGDLDGIIISPGPKSPSDCSNSGEIVKNLAGLVPILGVCLGHQVIGFVLGADIGKGTQPMHGKISSIYHNGTKLFSNLPNTYQVTRYHSLVISKETLPDCLQIDAWDTNDTIMAISHKVLPIYGVQFHPEAVLTEYGHELLENFVNICNDWRRNNYEYID